MRVFTIRCRRDRGFCNSLEYRCKRAAVRMRTDFSRKHIKYEQIDIIGGALLAIVFGGSLATFSYFIRKEQTSGTRKTSRLDKIVLFLIVLLSLIFVAQTIRYLLGAHVQFGVWPIFLSAIAMVFFNSETTKRLERTVKATVAATLMTAILVVTGWLIAFTDERALGFVLATGLVGLAWGGMILFNSWYLLRKL